MRLIGTLVAILSLPIMGHAADLQSKKTASPVPTFVGINWTGFYVGGNLGGAWTESSFTHLEGGATTGESFSNNPNGVIGGAQIGGRYQIQNNLVVGVEFAYSFRTADDQTRTDLAGVPRYRISEVGNILAISGNIGYAFDSYLAYIKGGYANTELRYSNNLVADNSVLGHSKSNVDGYVLGAGLEYAISKNISAGAEYNYYSFDVGNQQQYRPDGTVAAAINANNDLVSHSVVAKLNYRF